MAQDGDHRHGVGSDAAGGGVRRKHVFRYHGDGAQWNARASARSSLRSSAGGPRGGRPQHRRLLRHRRPSRSAVFRRSTRHRLIIRQLPHGPQVDGYFWVVGDRHRACAEGVRAAVAHQAHAALGEFVPLVLDGFQDMSTRLVGAARPEVEGGELLPRLPQKCPTPAAVSTTITTRRRRSTAAGGAAGTRLQNALPRTPRRSRSNGGNVTQREDRQAIQDQWPVQIVKGPTAQRPR